MTVFRTLKNRGLDPLPALTDACNELGEMYDAARAALATVEGAP